MEERKEQTPLDDSNNLYLVQNAKTEITPLSGTKIKYSLGTAEKGAGTFTYLPAGSPYDEKMPPPLYLPQEILAKPKPIELEEILKGTKITDDGYIKCVDEEICERQKGILFDVVKKVAALLIEGKGIVGLSLPVRIFEPRSTVDRIVDLWSFAPEFLSRAAKTNDPIERMKHVIAFAIAGLHLSVSQWKPFNPLLGETFQGYFADGTKVYCEHTSHHPPITNFYLVNPEFKYYGYYEYVGGFSSNTLTTFQNGPNTVEFNDGQKITFYLPDVRIKGMLFGDRLIKWGGAFVFIDPMNKVKAVIHMSNEKGSFLSGPKRTDVFDGKIYFANPKGFEPKRLPLCSKADRKDLFTSIYKMDDMEKEISAIGGSWLNELIIDKKIWWSIQKHKPMRHFPSTAPLPTDCRFREDLLWVYYGNLIYAEAWKLSLEERQRAERKFRQDWAKKNESK